MKRPQPTPKHAPPTSTPPASAHPTSSPTEKSSTPTPRSSLPARLTKYTLIGLVLTLFNFLVYTFLAQVVIGDNDLLWLATGISYLLSTFLAYFLHSRITWRERPISRHGVLMFFVWNLLTALVISPFATWIFGFFTPLYELAYRCTSALHLPLTYDFVESTGIFCLTTLVTMTLNYLCYDRLVFGSTSRPPKP